MIETPVKSPPPSGPPELPPPDARTRVMDPPPDPDGRHEFACDACGAPLHVDQAACLTCGAMVDQSGGGAGIRRAAVGSATALLVLSGAMGAAVAGLPHGKDIPKPKDGQVIGKAPLPPATTEDNSAGNDTTPLPGASGPSDPPALDSPEPPKADGVPSTGDASPNSGSAGGTGGTGSSDDSDDESSDKKDDPEPKKDPPAKEPSWVKNGSSPIFENTRIWEGRQSASRNALYRAVDGSQSTAFELGRAPIGIVLSGEGDVNAIGLMSKDDDYFVEVYTSDAEEPPSDLAGWDRSDRANRATTRQKLAIESGAVGDEHTLVLFNSTIALTELKLIY